MKNQLLSACLLTGGLLIGPATSAFAQTPVYVRWPFTVNSSDSAAVRSANTTVNPLLLRRFVVADGTATATENTVAIPVKPYSSAFGVAFAPLAAGGNWGTSLGGPGGAANREYSSQLSVTAPAGGTGLRADSLIVTSGFLNSSSKTSLAVVYSKSGFATDSADVSGSKGTAGVSPTAANGAFATPIALGQISTLPNTSTYRFALNGANGVTLNAGQTLTVRLYFSCSSSTNTGRYATMRDVILKSTQKVSLAARTVASTNLGVYPNPTQSQLTVPHAAATAGAQVLVYNATGARVFTQAAQPGSLETTVSLDALAKGLYLVEYADGGQRSTARIVKD